MSPAPADIFLNSSDVAAFRQAIRALAGGFDFDSAAMIALGTAYFNRYPDRGHGRNMDEVRLGYELVRICAIEKMVSGLPAARRGLYRTALGDAAAVGPAVDSLLKSIGPDGLAADLALLAAALDGIKSVIDEVKDEIEDVRTFYFSFEDPAVAKSFRVRSGQFIMCTVFGAGEFAVSLPFSPENDRPHLSVRQVGKVTRALHALRPGDKVGVRGPFGNGFPFEEIKGKNVVYVAGGIGLIPLRSSIVHVLQHRRDFGRILLIYGSKTSKELMYRYMIDEWRKTEGFETYFTIDNPEPGWTGHVGFVHTLVAPASIPVKDTVAFVCGPPLMFNAAIKELQAAGLKDEAIVSTLERHMKCGIGKCQHCAIGRTLVCTDGPVYTYKQIKTLGEQI